MRKYTIIAKYFFEFSSILTYLSLRILSPSMAMTSFITFAIIVVLIRIVNIELASYMNFPTSLFLEYGFRSALTARKIEEHLANIVKNNRREKPVFLIEYGHFHADMILYLKHKKLRDFAINIHSLWKSPFFDNSHVKKIYRIDLSKKNTSLATFPFKKEPHTQSQAKPIPTKPVLDHTKTLLPKTLKPILNTRIEMSI